MRLFVQGGQINFSSDEKSASAAKPYCPYRFLYSITYTSGSKKSFATNGTQRQSVSQTSAAAPRLIQSKKTALSTFSCVRDT
jgi:hypothetical protein